MAAAHSLVVLGRLMKPHGVKGEIRVEYYAESPELLEKPLMLRAGHFAPRPVRVVEWNLWKNQLILRLEGCDDRSQAECLRGQELLIDASFLPESEDDAPYLRDLAGLSVRLENGTELGKLEDVSFPSSQELWHIRTPKAEGGHEILFPAVPDFVRNIDLSAGIVTIAPPAGLVELYCGGAASNRPDDGQDEEDSKA